MKIETTPLPGVLVLTPAIYRDDRGAFMETFNLRQMAEAGLPANWVQDNFSLSKKNVLRGIHYQIAQPQGKLVRVTHGAVLDVAMDLRRSSPGVRTECGRGVERGERPDAVDSAWVRARIPGSERCGGICLQGDGLLLSRRRANDCVERSGVGDSLADCAADAIVSEKDRKGARLRDAEVFA